MNAEGDQTPLQLWLKTECQCDTHGTIPAHTYTNIVMTFNSDVPNPGNSIVSKSANFTDPRPLLPDPPLDKSNVFNQWIIDRGQALP